MKKTTDIGYRIAKKFSEKSDAAKLNAEMLGLMVNDPNVKPEEFNQAVLAFLGQ